MKRATAGSFRVGAVALALTALAGCGGPPPGIEFDATAEHAQTADGLHRVKARRIGAAWLRPGASFAAYDAVLFDPVSVSYKSPPRSASSGKKDRSRSGNFALGDENTARLRRIFQEAFEKQLGESDVFSVASEAGPNVLRVSGQIVDLVVNVPRQSGRDRLFVMDAGEMTLILDVRDSLSGRALARIADRRAIRPTSAGATRVYESGPVNNWSAVRQITNDWARFLRQGLDDLGSLSVQPGQGVRTAD
jgi:hypothetical protein